MTVAAWFVWRPLGFKAAAIPPTLFTVHLVLNVAWSWIPFGMYQPGWAFVEIVIFWLTILATTGTFFQCSQFADWLLVLNLARVSFAIWWTNV